jgi:glucose-fructose oxidoreductase
MGKVRWAVVGTSDFALDWIARGVTLGDNAELAAIVSRDAARAKAGAERAGAPLSYDSIAAIDTSLVDGVFLVLPNPQHAPFAIEAARRGLHVIVEKPMAPTLAECDAMIAAARESGVTLAVAHCMAWAPPVVRARELVAEGAIGEVIEANIACSFNSAPNGTWRQTDTTEQGGGALFDVGVHSLDAITRVVGAPVEQVAAFIERRLHDYAAEDTATLLVRYANGAHGTVQANNSCNQNSMEIVGSQGRLYAEPWLGREFAGALTLFRKGEARHEPLDTVNVYKPQIEHISACVLSGEPPIVAGEVGRAHIATIVAAIESARTGRVVTL